MHALTLHVCRARALIFRVPTNTTSESPPRKKNCIYSAIIPDALPLFLPQKKRKKNTCRLPPLSSFEHARPPSSPRSHSFPFFMEGNSSRRGFLGCTSGWVGRTGLGAESRRRCYPAKRSPPYASLIRFHQFHSTRACTLLLRYRPPHISTLSTRPCHRANERVAAYLFTSSVMLLFIGWLFSRG